MLNFLLKVLPSAGKYACMFTHPGIKKPEHRICSSIQELANTCHQLDAMIPGVHVYFALSSYHQGWYQDGDKMKFRTQSNAAFQKAFWIDIDIGPGDDKKHETKREALLQLNIFCKSKNLPTPMIIESRNGYHCYWVLDKDIATAQWMSIAKILKKEIAASGLLVDQHLTSNPASVLRPVGTHHRKTDTPFQIVKRVDTTPISAAAFKAALSGQQPVLQVIDDEEFEPSFADAPSGMVNKPHARDIIKACAQLRSAAEGKSKWSEPLLFGIVSVLSKCEKGREATHILSKTFSGYSEEYNDAKFDMAVEADHAPMLCETFELNNKGGCEGCPHRGLCTSPLHIKPPKIAPEGLDKFPDFIREALATKEMNKFDVCMDKDKFGIYMQMSDGIEGEPKKKWEAKILSVVLLPMYTVTLSDGTVNTIWREVREDGEEIDHAINSTQATNAHALGSWLYDNHITFMLDHKMGVLDFMNSFWFGAAPRHPKVTQNSHFGWIEPKRRYVNGVEIIEQHKFIMGNEVFTAHTKPMIAVLDKNIKAAADKLESRGSIDVWHKMLATYLPPKYRWAQATIAAGFGAVMAKWIGNTDGFPLFYLYEKDGGAGKTTAMSVASAIYGDPAGFMVAAGTTINGRIGEMVQYHSIPTFQDEITLSKVEDLEPFLMAISQGKEKYRLNTDGSAGGSYSGREWKTMVIATGNKDFATQIASSSDVSLPVMARLLQIDISHMERDAHPDPDIKEILDLRNTNYGITGKIWVQYLLDNFDKCVARMREIRREVTSEFGEQSSERIWFNALALTKFGTEVAGELGLHPFKWENIKPECARWVIQMRSGISIARSRSSDWLSLFLRDVSKQTIICRASAKPAPEAPGDYIHTATYNGEAPAARVDIEDGTITIPLSRLSIFANKQGVTTATITQYWTDTGMVIAATVMKRLGAHTAKYATPPERCVVLKYDTSELINRVSALREEVEYEQG